MTLHRCLAALAMSPLLFSSAFAAVEKWTTQDGKTSELELRGVQGLGAEAVALFRDKDGAAVTIKLAELQEADRARALAAGPLPTLTFRHTTLRDAAMNRVEATAPGKKTIEFTFEIGGGKIFGAKPGSLKLQPVKAGGAAPAAGDFEIMGGGDSGGKDYLTLRTKTAYDGAALAGMELRGTVVLLCPSEIKEETGTVTIPGKAGEKTRGKAGKIGVTLERHPGDRIVATADSVVPHWISTSFVLPDRRVRNGAQASLFQGQTVQVAVAYASAQREVEVEFTGAAAK